MSERKEYQQICNKDKRPRISSNENCQASDESITSVQRKVKKLITEISQKTQSIKQQEKLKHEQVQLIIPLVKEMSSKQIQDSFDLHLCVELASQFVDCHNDSEFEMLNVVEIIAQCAAELQNEVEHSKFSDIIIKSGLYQTIIKCFYAKVPKGHINQNDLIDSNSLKQLSRIYCYMLSFSIEDEDLSWYSEQIICSNISNYIKLINFNSKNIINPQIDITEKMLNELNLSKYMKELENLLKALKYGTKDEDEGIHLNENFKSSEDICKLFHINCPNYLNCKHKMNFPINFNPKSLHLLALEVLGQFPQIMNNPNLYYVGNSRVVDHLAPIIIQFATNYLLAFKQKCQLTSDSSQQQFSIYFNLLHCLVTFNKSFVQVICEYPGLLNSILALVDMYEKVEQIESQNIITKIRYQSIAILSQICQYGNENYKYHILVEMNLFRQLVQTAGIAGGSEESNNEIIESAKSYYCYVIQSIIRDINGQIAKSSILQQTNELLEEEGGIEEFDSLENLYEDWKFISLS